MRPWLIILALFLSLSGKTEAQDRRVSLLFAGDAMQHQPQVRAAKIASGYDYDTCFYLIKEKISRADISGINFETSLGGAPYRGYPSFSSPDEFANSLQETGFNLFFMANNHVLDNGKRGLKRTIRHLDQKGIKHCGAYLNESARKQRYPLILTKNGIRMAFLNYTYGTNGLRVDTPLIVNYIDTLKIKEDLNRAAARKPDITIANIHWGDEYSLSPNKAQRQLADFLIKNGVRIIIGHHPHVVQPIEKRVMNDTINSVIYYSLGNFVSNQRQTDRAGGAIAEISLIKKEGQKEIVIESCDYSLIWVLKRNEGNKPFYTVIPVEQIATIPILRKAEVAEIEKFASRANKILQKQ